MTQNPSEKTVQADHAAEPIAVLADAALPVVTAGIGVEPLATACCAGTGCC